MGYPTGETERGLMFIGRVICHDMPRSQTSSPHLTSKPILPFPKGRNKLLCFVKDFSKSIQPMNISPHLASPVGEGQLLLLLIND